MLPLSYGLEVIHFLEQRHHRHQYHQQHEQKTAEYQMQPQKGETEALKTNLSFTDVYGTQPMELAFRGISKSCAQKTILCDISGAAKPGELLAVMGPSGSGKTTLLNVLSGRSKADSGFIALNGEPLNKNVRRRICYVLQQDILLPNLTLRQTLKFAAILRLPGHMSHREKMDFMEHLIDILDLRHCLDTLVGDNVKRGLSGGERKRANIACELLTNPTMMLLDEPTTGLDSSTAYTLMEMLKKYAVDEKKTVVVSIHQPSSQIFHMFDSLLLLADGQVAYFGSQKKVIGFFESLALTIAPHYNPADFLMEQLKKGAELQERILMAARKLQMQREILESVKDLEMPPAEMLADSNNCNDHLMTVDCQHCQILMWNRLHDCEHKTSEEMQKCEFCSCVRGFLPSQADKFQPVDIHVTIDSNPKTPSVNNNFAHVLDRVPCTCTWFQRRRSCPRCSQHLDYGPTWPTSFWVQLKVLTQRNFLECRKRMLSKLNWAQTIGLGIVCGLMWFQVKREETSLFDLKGWMFFSCSYWMLFALFEALVSFPPENVVINKERASGAYRLSAYYFAKMIGELPLMITLPTVFHFISYPMLGFQGSSTFLYMWALLLLSTVVAQSVGLFIGASCTDLQMSVTISSLYSLSTMLFGGYYASTIPPWLSWLRYLSMVHYTFQSMQTVEFSMGRPIRCADKNSAFGACKSGNSTFIPRQDLLHHCVDSFPIWANMLVLLLFLLTFRMLGYLVLRCFRKPK